VVRSSVPSFQLLLLAAVKSHLLLFSASFSTVSRHLKCLTFLVEVKCLINSTTAAAHRPNIFKVFYTIFLQYHGKFNPRLLVLRLSALSFQLLLLTAVKVHLLFLSTSFFTVSRHVKWLPFLNEVGYHCWLNSKNIWYFVYDDKKIKFSSQQLVHL